MDSTQGANLPTPEFVLAWVFGWAAAVLIVWYVARRRKDRRIEMIHKERLAAIEKGIPLVELPNYEADRDSLWVQVKLNPRWPLGVGAVFVMLGLGMIAALALSEQPRHNQTWSFGLIPVFFGVGLFLHYLLTRKQA